MTDGARRELGAFLRSHRERLSAGEAGQPAGGRRRTPGLRREEVAALCGMSPTWLTWIEQGRDVSASPQALSRLSDALRLSQAERAYLFELARKQDPRAAGRRPEPAPAAIGQVLAATTVPAYGLDRLWRACGWNDAAARLFAPWLGRPEPNLLAFVFCDPAARRFIHGWDERARRLVAEFRADTSRLGADPEVNDLVSRLRRESQAFEGFWQAQDVLAREGGPRVFSHPEDGLLRYEQATLHLSGHDQFKIVMLFPVDSTDADFSGELRP